MSKYENGDRVVVTDGQGPLPAGTFGEIIDQLLRGPYIKIRVIGQDIFGQQWLFDGDVQFATPRAGDLVEIGGDCEYVFLSDQQRVDSIHWDAENGVEKAKIVHGDEAVYYDFEELKVIKLREED